MPTLKLNARTLARLAAPDPSGKQVLHFDADLKGFGILCSGTTNSKTYVVQRAVNGKARRVTVGAVNQLSLDEARAAAAGGEGSGAGVWLGHSPVVETRRHGKHSDRARHRVLVPRADHCGADRRSRSESKDRSRMGQADRLRA